jgi:hypothetical protein
VSSDQTIAETLPRLYREVLDRIARLEELGAGHEAARRRSEAIAMYSRAWDSTCHKRLHELMQRIDSEARDLEHRPRTSPV